MDASSLWPFQSPPDHERVSAIIRQRSTNSVDVRDVALGDLDLSFAKNVLDLGCGFGFMAEPVARRVAADAELIGVDTWAANETPFVERVAAAGRSGRFVCLRVDSQLPWPDRSFDLVVCSYSLYFFADVLGELARVLAPHGLLLATTHTEGSIVSLLQAAGLTEVGSQLLSLVRSFSAETGPGLLGRWFGEVTRIDYRNALRFTAEHEGELLDYLQFKLPLLVPGSKPDDELPEGIRRFARASVSGADEVAVDKSDAVFRCRIPLCP